jgi:hypothetical protein
MNTIVVLSTMRSGAMPDGEGAFIELETSEGMLELLHCADAAALGNHPRPNIAAT